ncbi:thermonuclease family protein [Vampirovibrio chlorellavorus]|uniref:thermonuclease family protein n=1 Tax=Vampirovibrio chlorellavorus TaxID=758823 RepID=UPI0026EA3CB4|nr:thermonuclease family protein [Vampirovibrio chlorellavorus]
MRFRFRVNEKWLGIGLTVLGVAGLALGLWLPRRPEGPAGWSRSAVPVAAALAGAPASVAAATSSSGHRLPCRVLTVFDGDTLGCDLNGDGRLQKPREQVRLLGIDSPEMHYSRKNATYGSEHPEDEPFATEASHWLTKQASGKTVYLEFDARRQDKYERTLAYVFATAKAQQSLNQKLLEQGYATVLFLGKNRRYQAEFEATEAQARTAQRGLWATSR